MVMSATIFHLHASILGFYAARKIARKKTYSIQS